MKKLFLAAFVALLAINLSSCDNGTDPTPADIVGSWQVTHQYEWLKVNDEIDEDESIDEPVTNGDITTFNSDRTGETEGEAFTWSLSGKTLTMNFDNDEYGTGNYTVEELTSSKAIISQSSSTVVDGDTREYYWRQTFAKLD